MAIKTIIIFFFSSILLFTLSCNHAKNKDEANQYHLLSFPKTIQMDQFRVEERDFDIFKEPELLIHDTLLFILDRHYVDGFIRVYDIRTFESITSFGVIGNGPGEYRIPARIAVDYNGKDLWFIDFGTLSFNCIAIDSQLKGIFKKRSVIDYRFTPVFNYHILSNGNILISTTTESDYFSEINSKGETEKTWGVSNYPRTNIQHQMDYNYFYYKNIAFNEKLNVAVTTYHFHDIVVRYDFSNNKRDIYTKKEFDFVTPDVSPKGNVFNKYKAYSLQIKYNNDFVFASYLGDNSISGNNYANLSINYPREIHVFDWDAQPIAKLVFSDPIISFDLCEKGYIYVYSNTIDAPLRIYELNL